MYARVEYVNFEKYRRILVISDVHADKKGFLGVLEKTKFGREDALVIVGDILGRGADSVELLRMVMEMYKQGNIYAVMGNHDIGFVKRNRSQVTEEEYAFVEGLPHIIDCRFAAFVHAGIRPGKLEEQDAEYCLSAKAFGEENDIFEKPVIVGHWPASNYSRDVIDANTYHNPKTNVICLDGGNSMKRWGQINYLIMNAAGEILESDYYDHLPRIQALENQAESAEYFTLFFPHTELEIRECREEESVCYVPWLKRELTIHNECIYEYKGKTYCSDMTTYCLPVRAGEILTYCAVAREGLQVKRNGIIGNYHGKFREIDCIL